MLNSESDVIKVFGSMSIPSTGTSHNTFLKIMTSKLKMNLISLLFSSIFFVLIKISTLFCVFTRVHTYPQ